ncbi:MAG: helix-turn-helix domain-containing protein [Acidobacteria bacterium]|nr:helix-turn-helix domain-containing protein [Acidobacteriota bacterium]
MNLIQVTKPSRHEQPTTTNAPHEELIHYYLRLPVPERHQQFANTSRAAAIAGCSQRTVQRWVEEGSVRAVYVVGRQMILIASLHEFIEGEARMREYS